MWVWQVRPLQAVVERVPDILELAEEAAGIDTGFVELVGKAGPTRICHRIGRSLRAVDRKTSRAS